MLAVTPVGEAADGWVKRAIYARNAGSVDGFSASKSPKKGKLVVLPKSGKLPASILPASAGGSSGAPGSPGAAGDGSSAVFVGTGAAAVNVGATQTGVVTLSLKAGSYAIVAKASLHATLDTSTPGVNCQLKAGGDGDQIDADLSSSSDDPGRIDHHAHVRGIRQCDVHVRGRRRRRGCERRPHRRAARELVGHAACP